MFDVDSLDETIKAMRTIFASEQYFPNNKIILSFFKKRKKKRKKIPKNAKHFEKCPK